MISAEPSYQQTEGRACRAPTRRLAGRMAVLTGASSGIGRAIAEELAAAGASLCLVGRRPQMLREVAPCMAEDARRMVYQVDLAAREQIEAFATSFVRDGGQADILVHGAGVISIGALENASADDFDWQLSVNVRAPYILTKALLPLVKNRRGQIVFVNSNAGLCAVAGSGQYSASKHALTGLADSLRGEVNGQVRVMSVYAGSTATPMQAALHVAKRRVYAPELLIQPKDVASLVVHALSLPRSVEVTALHMRPGASPG
jgi:NADP-dependent 3-hydroxy acid dehydrogenase YdfG